jgi:hypothetical protein
VLHLLLMVLAAYWAAQSIVGELGGIRQQA